MIRIALALAVACALASCATRPPNRIPGCAGHIAAYAICDDTGEKP